MAAWLVAQVVTGEQQDDAVLAAAYQRLRHLTIEPPTPERMERIVHSALHTHETTLQRHVLAALSPVPLGPAEMAHFSRKIIGCAGHFGPIKPSVRHGTRRSASLWMGLGVYTEDFSSISAGPNGTSLNDSTPTDACWLGQTLRTEGTGVAGGGGKGVLQPVLGVVRVQVVGLLATRTG